MGTGLGLANVDATVKEHGGWITVEMELGRGRSFESICRLRPRGTKGLWLLWDQGEISKFKVQSAKFKLECESILPNADKQQLPIRCALASSRL